MNLLAVNKMNNSGIIYSQLPGLVWQNVPAASAPASILISVWHTGRQL